MRPRHTTHNWCSVLSVFGPSLFSNPSCFLHIAKKADDAGPNIPRVTSISLLFRDEDAAAALEDDLAEDAALYAQRRVMALNMVAARAGIRGLDNAADVVQFLKHTVHQRDNTVRNDATLVSLVYAMHGIECKNGEAVEATRVRTPPVVEFVPYRIEEVEVGYRQIPPSDSADPTATGGAVRTARTSTPSVPDAARRGGVRSASARSVRPASGVRSSDAVTDAGEMTSLLYRLRGTGSYGCVYQNEAGNAATKVFNQADVGTIKASVGMLTSKLSKKDADMYFIVPYDIRVRNMPLRICPTALTKAEKRGKDAFSRYNFGVYSSVLGEVDLQNLQANHPKMSTPYEIAKSAIEAVGVLCKTGIVHGDVKTPNMMMHQGRAKLIDLDGIIDMNDTFTPLKNVFAFRSPTYFLVPPEFLVATGVEDDNSMGNVLAWLRARVKNTGFEHELLRIPGAIPDASHIPGRDVLNVRQLNTFREDTECYHSNVWSDSAAAIKLKNITKQRYDAYGLGLLLLSLVINGVLPTTMVKPVVAGLVQWDPRKRSTPSEALIHLERWRRTAEMDATSRTRRSINLEHTVNRALFSLSPSPSPYSSPSPSPSRRVG